MVYEKSMKSIFVNGTFDILHPGHIQLLNYAKSLGDTLTVGIDSDRRVREKKGYARPVYNVGDRAYMLQNLKAVDYVVIFDSDEELERCIKTVKPDIMVVGSDWKGKSVIGSMYSAELRFFDRIEEYATTKTIQSIINR
jgi:rfaE bifunctional protein nucleotidyltransferase chain/domain|tara:strand:- start:599 stop:1015 length:417 start_codon:yes stop_codon:yes gene_type:complete